MRGMLTMKKLICSIVSFILFSLTLCTAASAQTPDTVDLQNYLGVIRNAEGEIVETIPMPRHIYVDSVVDLSANLKAGYTFTTYQYKPKGGFTIGFNCTDDYGDTVTTRNRKVKMEIYNSASVGGKKYLVESGTYSTNEEDNDPTFGGWIEIDADHNSSRPYFNGVFTNMSNKELTIRIGVFCEIE